MGKLKLRRNDKCYSCMCDYVILVKRKNYKHHTFNIYCQCPKCLKDLRITRKLADRDKRIERRKNVKFD